VIAAVGDSLWEKSSPAVMAAYVRVSMPGFFSHVTPAPPSTENFVVSLSASLYPRPPVDANR
jgi:hypothetical protein